jgi:hypothetical protein
MKPHCHNRDPRPATYTANAGFVDGVLMTREIPWFSEDRCATWDGHGIGPNGERYPEAHGWDCAGCRWLLEGNL